MSESDENDDEAEGEEGEFEASEAPPAPDEEFEAEREGESEEDEEEEEAAAQPPQPPSRDFSFSCGAGDLREFLDGITPICEAPTIWFDEKKLFCRQTNYNATAMVESTLVVRDDLTQESEATAFCVNATHLRNALKSVKSGDAKVSRQGNKLVLEGFDDKTFVLPLLSPSPLPKAIEIELPTQAEFSPDTLRDLLRFDADLLKIEVKEGKVFFKAESDAGDVLIQKTLGDKNASARVCLSTELLQEALRRDNDLFLATEKPVRLEHRFARHYDKGEKYLGKASVWLACRAE